MSKAMGTGIQVVNRCIPSLVFMLKRIGKLDGMELLYAVATRLGFAWVYGMVV